MAFWLSYAKKILAKAVSGESHKRDENSEFIRRCKVCGRVFSEDFFVDGTCVLCRTANEKGRSKGGGEEKSGSTGPFDDMAAAYKILGCKEDDSDDHIKKRYRHLIKECHVDSLPPDLPEYLVAAANRRFREVHESYQRIVKSRNSRTQ